MLLYLGKLLLLFVLTIIVIRVMGKAALAQLAPHDIAAIVFIVTIAVGPITTDKLGRAIIGLIAVAACHILFSRLALFRWLNQLIIGQPTILIKHGKILKSNLKRSRYSLIELLASIRKAGYPDIHDVKYAILEPTGDISVLPKDNVVSVTPRHLNLDVKYEGIPISVIIEGRIQHKNLNLINKDRNWLEKQIESMGVTNLNKVFYATVKDTDHSVVIDTGEGKMLT